MVIEDSGVTGGSSPLPIGSIQLFCLFLTQSISFCSWFEWMMGVLYPHFSPSWGPSLRWNCLDFVTPGQPHLLICLFCSFIPTFSFVLPVLAGALFSPNNFLFVRLPIILPYHGIVRNVGIKWMNRSVYIYIYKNRRASWIVVFVWNFFNFTWPLSFILLLLWVAFCVPSTWVVVLVLVLFSTQQLKYTNGGFGRRPAWVVN